jgi:probable rRNA maturation factor
LKALQSRIQIQNRQKRYKIDRMQAVVLCGDFLRDFEKDAHALSVAFVGVREMRRINRMYRHKDYATDVLSFTFGETEMEGAPFAGEIIIAPEVAVRQARRYGIHPDREIKKLLVHGMLHLLGYDHEVDGGEMRRIQDRLMRRAFIRNASPILLV